MYTGRNRKMNETDIFIVQKLNVFDCKELKNYS